MRVEIHSREAHVSDEFRTHIEQRMEKLTKFFDHIVAAHVSFNAHRGQYRAEITVHASRVVLRGEEQQDTLRAAFDEAMDKVVRRIKKLKERLQKRWQGANRQEPRAETAEEPVSEVAAESGEQEPTIVRTKRFSFKPMTPEEAALQMELLQHDFFVFTNGDTDEVNVIYRRRDGNYGLIEPMS